jgi:hypothetical protein
LDPATKLGKVGGAGSVGFFTICLFVSVYFLPAMVGTHRGDGGGHAAAGRVSHLRSAADGLWLWGCILAVLLSSLGSAGLHPHYPLVVFLMRFSSCVGALERGFVVGFTVESTTREPRADVLRSESGEPGQ